MINIRHFEYRDINTKKIIGDMEGVYYKNVIIGIYESTDDIWAQMYVSDGLPLVVMINVNMLTEKRRITLPEAFHILQCIDVCEASYIQDLLKLSSSGNVRSDYLKIISSEKKPLKDNMPDCWKDYINQYNQ